MHWWEEMPNPKFLTQCLIFSVISWWLQKRHLMAWVFSILQTKNHLFLSQLVEFQTRINNKYSHLKAQPSDPRQVADLPWDQWATFTMLGVCPQITLWITFQPGLTQIFHRTLFWNKIRNKGLFRLKIFTGHQQPLHLNLKSILWEERVHQI